MGLKAELNKLTSECETGSDLEVDYYSTGLPNKLPITIEGLTKLIEEFPSRMKDINEGRGVPITVILLVFYLSPEVCFQIFNDIFDFGRPGEYVKSRRIILSLDFCSLTLV